MGIDKVLFTEKLFTAGHQVSEYISCFEFLLHEATSCDEDIPCLSLMLCSWSLCGTHGQAGVSPGHWSDSSCLPAPLLLSSSSPVSG